MKDKCTKFEALFTFGSEEDLQAHIKECEDCRNEYERMQKISSLIKEVKPHFKKKNKKMQLAKIACTLLFLTVTGVTAGVMNYNTEISDTLKYGTILSAEDLGFPVDNYGLIMVE